MTINLGPAVTAQQQLNALKPLEEEMTTDQRLQLGLLAAQIEVADRLKSIESNLEVWTEHSLSVRVQED